MSSEPIGIELEPGLLSAIRQTCDRAPCIAALGLELVAARPGFARVHARHDPRFDGVLAGFHGGMMANVADCVAWFAIVTQTGPLERLVTTDLDMRYLSPCLTDLVAVGRVIKLGRTLCPVALELFDTAQKLVAVGQVTYMRLEGGAG